MKKFILVARIAVAIILIQTLRFKFTGHPDSIYIFETVGLEPFGRIGIGIVELIAGLLLLFTRTAWIGSLLTVGVIGGAIIMHLSILGIEINNDGGTLFATALVTFGLATVILLYYRNSVPLLKKLYTPRPVTQ
ncbi:MAG: DoxX family membrane protein [Bacteroidota bacterium]